MDEHTLNDLLECSVCLERLDTSSKVLPCQHTFCRKCLEEILSSHHELRCPECRILVKIKIDDLPPNVLLMRILEGMKNSVTKTQQETELEATSNGQRSEDVNVIKKDEPVQQQQQAISNLPAQQNQQQRLNKQQAIQQHQPPQQQAQPQQQQQQLAPSTSSINNVNLSGNQRRSTTPHACALFDFSSNEPSDLHFKKGDIILLKRQIDTYWFVGQLSSGAEGTFPINYVKVIVPLAPPQCIALYDFQMGPNEEEGCLSFKKGTKIQVLRRVDQNWAEGRIGTTIGIFPISFVELNPIAKQILGNFVSNTSTAQSNKAVGTSSQAGVGMPQQRHSSSAQYRNLPSVPVLDPTTNSHSSSSATSPHSTATTCSTSSSATNSLPNSPSQSLPNTPQHTTTTTGSVRYRDCREKRHSLNALLSAGAAASMSPSLSAAQSNRHSAEILSVPNEPNNQKSTQPFATQTPNSPSCSTSAAATALSQANSAADQQETLMMMTTQSRVNVLRTAVQQNVPPTLPWGYLALYPYKPQKNDELELKKGCVYIVTERCMDGWYKGKNWQEVCGVFPGNYVTPLRSRDQQQLMHQWKYVPLQYTGPAPATNKNTANAHLNTNIANCGSAMHNTTEANWRLGALQHQPPALPPRDVGNVQTPHHSVWIKPLSATVEAFFNRHGSSNSHNKTITANTAHAEHREKEPKRKESQHSTTTCASSSAAVSLMKRLTSIKSRSKSPSNVTLNNATTFNNFQQPQQQHQQQQQHKIGADEILPHSNLIASSGHTHSKMHPVHVRSGSCPSQLLQSLPIEYTAQVNENHCQQSKNQLQHVTSQVSPQAMYGSQRIKGNKERPQMQNLTMRQSVDGSFRGIKNNLGLQSQPQGQPQLPPPPPPPQLILPQVMHSKCRLQQQQQQPQQYQQQQQQINTNLHSNAAPQQQQQQRNTQTLDASTLATSAPLTATIQNVSAAAIAASATTKSATIGQESRFRCVVPYPPNSEVELELHVGDIVYVQRKQKNGWLKGTHARTNKTGLFPASFVEPDH